MQPINFHYKDQMQRSLVLDCFFQKKRSKRSRKTTPGSGTNKSNNKEELSKAFSKLQFDEATAVFVLNFPPLHDVFERKMHMNIKSFMLHFRDHHVI